MEAEQEKDRFYGVLLAQTGGMEYNRSVLMGKEQIVMSEKIDRKKQMGELLKAVGGYVLAFLKWCLAAGVLGCVCGLVGAGFHKSVDFVTELRMETPWLVWFLPLAGVLTLLLYRLCRVSFAAGTNLIIESVTTNEHIPILLAPLIFAGTVLSHLFGASVGREGAALQLGGSIGHNFGELFRFDEEDVRVLSMCGMAACFSALFGTPLTASVFVLEVIMVGSVSYNALLPCVFSAYASFFTASQLGVEPLSFPLVSEIPEPTLPLMGQVVALGAVCAVVGILFCVCVHTAGHLAEKLLKNAYLRIAAGGLLMAVLTVLFGFYDYNGAGTGVIAAAIGGKAAPEAFLLKLLLTALCVGVGYRGGEIVPTLFIGATLGCVVGPLLGLPAELAAALALVALFCSVVNCPIASVFLAVELFGTLNLTLFVIVIVVAFVLSGYYGLYSSQKIVFSKIKQQIINTSTK